MPLLIVGQGQHFDALFPKAVIGFSREVLLRTVHGDTEVTFLVCIFAFN